MKNVLFSNHFVCNLITKRKVTRTSDTEGECVLWDQQEGTAFRSTSAFQSSLGNRKGKPAPHRGLRRKNTELCQTAAKQKWPCVLFLGAECGRSHLGSLSRIHFYLTPCSQNTHRCPNTDTNASNTTCYEVRVRQHF